MADGPWIAGACLGLSGLAVACTPSAPRPSPVTLDIGGHTVIAEQAISSEDQEHGLKNRPALPPGHGMLFVLTKPSSVCMWMKDTPAALSVAFLDVDGTIINIANMAPQTETQHCSLKPAKYALEVPSGWFTTIHVGAGTVVRGLARAGA